VPLNTPLSKTGKPLGGSSEKAQGGEKAGGGGGAGEGDAAGGWKKSKKQVQGYLAHKKHPPP